MPLRGGQLHGTLAARQKEGSRGRVPHAGEIGRGAKRQHYTAFLYTNNLLLVASLAPFHSSLRSSHRSSLRSSQVNVTRSAFSRVTISFETIQDADVPTGDAYEKLDEKAIRERKIRARINFGSITLVPFVYGQTIMTCEGDLAIDVKAPVANDVFSFDRRELSKTKQAGNEDPNALSNRVGTMGTDLGTAAGWWSGETTDTICSSMQDIFVLIKHHFDQADEIDDRKRKEVRQSEERRTSPL